MQALRCHLCGSEHLEHLSGTESFVRVTSDCQVWKPGGRLAQCQECALVQAEITPAWIEGCDHIYRNYDIYHQAGGIEQSVFNDQGSAQTRSRQMLEFVRQRGAFPTQGKVLDIGCGNGSFLAEFSRNFSQWELHGLEYNSKHLDALQSIPRFHKLHSQNLSAISPKQFDLICLIHTLEHIVNPLQFLKDVANLLTDDGVLFIQVPHYPENPFELFTADHASHFTVGSLSHLLTNCGFAVQSVTTQWVRREISLIAKLQFAMAPPHPLTRATLFNGLLSSWQKLRKHSRSLNVLDCLVRPLPQHGRPPTCLIFHSFLWMRTPRGQETRILEGRSSVPRKSRQGAQFFWPLIRLRPRPFPPAGPTPLRNTSNLRCNTGSHSGRGVIKSG